MWEEQQERQPPGVKNGQSFTDIYSEEVQRSSRAWRRVMPKQVRVLMGESLANSCSSRTQSGLLSSGQLPLDVSPSSQTFPSWG